MGEPIYDSYTPVVWENGTVSHRTPLDAQHLGIMDDFIVKLSRWVAQLDRQKVDKNETYSMVKNVIIEQPSGDIVVSYLNGVTERYKTDLWRIPVDFDIDEENQQLVFTLNGQENGKPITKKIDISKLVLEAEFDNPEDSPIQFKINEITGHVSAFIKAGAIKTGLIDPGFMATIMGYADSASESAESSEGSAKLSESYAHGDTGVRTGEEKDNSKYYSQMSESYTHGGTTLRLGEDTDNAMYWSQQSENSAQSAEASRVGIIQDVNDIKDDALSQMNSILADTTAIKDDTLLAKYETEVIKNTAEESMEGYLDVVNEKLSNMEEIQNGINSRLDMPEFGLDENGNLVYEGGDYDFIVDEHGNLCFKVS